MGLHHTADEAPQLNYDAQGMSIGIVVSAFNSAVTKVLYDGALLELMSLGASPTNIVTAWAPGAFELPLIADSLLANGELDAVICLGCVIRGGTPHFDFICQACSIGIGEVALKRVRPVIFGVLTTNTLEEAKSRSGGASGNRGKEAARAAVAAVNTIRESRSTADTQPTKGART